MDANLLMAALLIIMPMEDPGSFHDNYLLRWQVAALEIEWQLTIDRIPNVTPGTSFRIHDIHENYERYKNYPLIEDAKTFDYSQDYIDAVIDFNSAHLHWLQSQKDIAPMYKQREWDSWVDETEKIQLAWFLLKQAKQSWLVTNKRIYLNSLKEELGKDYYERRMPPPVPLWRFQEK